MRLTSAGSPGLQLEPAAADRLRPQRRDQEEPGRRSQLVETGGEHLEVESALEAPVDLTGVSLQAALGVGMAGIDDLELHEPCAQQTLCFGERRDEARALLFAERGEKRARELVAAPVEHGPFRRPGRQ